MSAFALLSLIISAAFNMINHDQLPTRPIEEFGINGTVKDWIAFNLSGRSFFVCYGQLTSTKSAICSTSAGVPQAQCRVQCFSLHTSHHQLSCREFWHRASTTLNCLLHLQVRWASLDKLYTVLHCSTISRAIVSCRTETVLRKFHSSGRRSVDLLQELRLLPVQARVTYKVALLCFNS